MLDFQNDSRLMRQNNYYLRYNYKFYTDYNTPNALKYMFAIYVVDY